MSTIDIEGHSLTDAISGVEEKIVSILGQPLPPAAMPPKVYGGPNASLIIPTLRTTLGAGESFHLRALVLAPIASPKCQVTLNTKPMGGNGFSSSPMTNVGRSVFEVTTTESGDFEYYVSAVCGSNIGATFPVGAPTITQTVVIMP